MREHGEQCRVGLDEDDLDGPRVGCPDLLHDAGRAAEKGWPRPAGDRDLGTELALDDQRYILERLNAESQKK